MKILLYGPDIRARGGAYGGGVGGYTRNMQVYLKYFGSSEFEMVPSYHTVRTVVYPGSFIVRLIVDIARFSKSLFVERPAIVHLLAGYRNATLREFVIFWMAKLMRRPVVYEIKAGAFINWFEGTSRLYVWMTKSIIANASSILVEGRVYQKYLEEKFGHDSVYFPNVVPDCEIPQTVEPKLQRETLRLLFVGYCYEGKGVYELVNACIELTRSRGVLIELNLVGKEEEKFSSWLSDTLKKESGLGLVVRRLGVVPHDQVVQLFRNNDIYCYPSRHSGEGHNNSINEAMMMGMVIVCSAQGFLKDVIGEDCGFLLDEVSVECICDSIAYIASNREEANKRADNARQRLANDFPVSRAKEILSVVYHDILGPS